MLRVYHPTDSNERAYQKAIHEGVQVLSPSIFFGDKTELDRTLDHYEERGILPRTFREKIVYTGVDKIEIPLGMPTQLEGSVTIDLPHADVPLSVQIAAGPGGTYIEKLLKDLSEPELRKRGGLYKITLDHVKIGFIPRSVVDAIRSYDWNAIDGHVLKLQKERQRALQRANEVMRGNEPAQNHGQGLIQQALRWLRGR